MFEEFTKEKLDKFGEVQYEEPSSSEAEKETPPKVEESGRKIDINFLEKVSELVRERDEIKKMIKNMPKTVEVGSEWYIVSMYWIEKWQKYVNFDESKNWDLVSAMHPG